MLKLIINQPEKRKKRGWGERRKIEMHGATLY